MREEKAMSEKVPTKDELKGFYHISDKEKFEWSNFCDTHGVCRSLKDFYLRDGNLLRIPDPHGNAVLGQISRHLRDLVHKKEAPDEVPWTEFKDDMLKFKMHNIDFEK